MDVIVTRKYRGKEEDERSSLSIINSRTIKNTTLINEILKNAETEVSSQSFIVAINFKDVVEFEYKCSEDMVFKSQLSEVLDADLIQNGVAYVFDEFISQYEVITIIPNAVGMVLLMGEYKL